ncbi:MAG: DUF1566 domain-containing protein [Methylococcaceae bacterium]
MNKILFAVIALPLMVSVSHAKILSPVLVSPQNLDNIGIKQPIKFSWTHKSAATIKQYHLIISASERFADYDVGKGKCVKSTTCADFITKSTSYNMAAKHAFLQKQGTFFWQVQAVSKTNDKSLVFQGSVNTSSGSDIVRTQVNINKFFVAQKDVDIDDYNVNPPAGANGSTFDFSVTLSDELPAGQSVKIQYDGEDGWHEMKGAGVDYSYSHAFTIPTSINDKPINYVIGVFDDSDPSGEPIRRRNDTLTILAADDSTPVEPVPVVVKPEPVKPEPVKPVTVTVPNVSTISVSPQSVIQGNSLTFSTTLSGNLPSGYSVKVDYGNGLFAMSGSGTNYSFNVAPTSSAAYSIGVYDAKNTLKSNSQTGNFSVTAKNENPTLSLISGGISATIGTPYVTQLSASDSNLSLIFMDWGDGASESKNATSGATVSFSHNYATANSFNWNATAYDSQDATSLPVSKTVAVSKVVVAPVVIKTTGYSKIANNGSTLVDSAKLGANPTDWACTKDNKTGLIWEVKTTDGGLRDSANTYTNYTPDYPKCDDAIYGAGKCKEYGFTGELGDSTNTDGFVTAVNNQSLCGNSDWRLPTRDELQGLIYCSDGKYNKLTEESLNSKGYGYVCSSNEGLNLTTTSPTINATYFPDIKDNYWFWSSSPVADYSSYAWGVGFNYGYSSVNYKSRYYFVRLVR